jgi:hypothetical protein
MYERFCRTLYIQWTFKRIVASPSQEISLLWNPKVHDHFHKSPGPYSESHESSLEGTVTLHYHSVYEYVFQFIASYEAVWQQLCVLHIWSVSCSSIWLPYQHVIQGTITKPTHCITSILSLVECKEWNHYSDRNCKNLRHWSVLALNASEFVYREGRPINEVK